MRRMRRMKRMSDKLFYIILHCYHDDCDNLIQDVIGRANSIPEAEKLLNDWFAMKSIESPNEYFSGSAFQILGAKNLNFKINKTLRSQYTYNVSIENGSIAKDKENE